MGIDSERTGRLLRRTIQVLATVEAVDAVVYLHSAGGLAAHPALVVLTALGVVGAVLVWLSSRTVVLVTGALLVAVAPAIVYPLSMLLVLAAVALVVVVMRARRTLRMSVT